MTGGAIKIVLLTGVISLSCLLILDGTSVNSTEQQVDKRSIHFDDSVWNESKAQCSCQKQNNTRKFNEFNTSSQNISSKPGHNFHKDQLLYTDGRKLLYHKEGLELYLYAAYADSRFNTNVIRVFGVEEKGKVSKNFVCKWKSTEGSVDVLKQIKARKVLVDSGWPNITSHYATEIDCVLPAGTKLNEITVSPAEFEHSLTIPIDNYEYTGPKKSIAVCVKPVTGHIQVPRLVEWFELFQLVGVKDFIIYDLSVMGTARFVFDHYISLGLLKLRAFPFTFALLDHVDGPKMSGPERYGVYQQTYLLAMEDCLYRYQHMYEYLIYVDLDEVMLPKENISIYELAKIMQGLHPQAAAAMFLTAWHFEDFPEQAQNEQVPSNLYMQRNAHATIPQNIQPKSIIFTQHTLTVNFHGVKDVPDARHGNIRIWDYDKYGYIHHFRGRCIPKFGKEMCQNIMLEHRQDSVLIRYRDTLQKRVQHVMDILQMK